MHTIHEKKHKNKDTSIKNVYIVRVLYMWNKLNATRETKNPALHQFIITVNNKHAISRAVNA